MRTFLFGLLLSFCSCLSINGIGFLPKNAVKVGKCTVVGKVSPELVLQKVKIKIHTNDFYTEQHHEYQLPISEQGFVNGEIPMHTLHRFASLVVSIGDSTYKKMLCISQQENLHIDVVNLQNVVVKGSVESATLDILAPYIIGFEGDSPEDSIPNTMSLLQYKKHAENKYKELLLVSNKLFPEHIKQSEKAFLENWVKIIYSATNLLYPVRKRTDLPPSYFDFLTDFSLDEDLLYNFYGLQYFTTGLLYNPNLNIPPIAETPVASWISNLRTKFKGTSFVPTAFFCELMAFSSYQEQIFSGKPLTDKQIKNIKSGFKTQNWASLLLNKKAQ